MRSRHAESAVARTGVDSCASSRSVGGRGATQREVLRSVTDALVQLGVRVVSVERAQPRDVAIEWRGTAVAFAQPPSINDLFDAAIRRVEARIQTRLGDVIAADRIKVIRLLHEEGVFEVRGSVRRVGKLLGVCNTTVYAALRNLGNE